MQFFKKLETNGCWKQTYRLSQFSRKWQYNSATKFSWFRDTWSWQHDAKIVITTWRSSSTKPLLIPSLNLKIKTTERNPSYKLTLQMTFSWGFVSKSPSFNRFLHSSCQKCHFISNSLTDWPWVCWKNFIYYKIKISIFWALKPLMVCSSSFEPDVVLYSVSVIAL